MAAEMPRWFPAANATRMYPAWAIEEYASIRLTLFWMRAPKLPRVMESTAEIQMSQNHCMWVVANNTRSSTAKAAALGPVDISATTGAGAPSYTSGVQTWNGAEATLKPRPTIISAVAMKARILTLPLDVSWWASFSGISSRLVVPVAPNIRATP